MKRKRVSAGDVDSDEEPESFVHPTYTTKRRRKWHMKLFDSIGKMRFGDRWRILEDVEIENIGGEFNFNARIRAPPIWDNGEELDRVFNKTWRTFLGEAIFQGDENAFDKLLKRGVDPELPCAYEIIRITSDGPVMQMYRPLTYAVRRGRMDMLRHLLNAGVNLTHTPTDTVHALSVHDNLHARLCVAELGVYDAWIRSRYALHWLQKVPLNKTPWRDLIDGHIAPMFNALGYADWAHGEYVQEWAE